MKVALSILFLFFSSASIASTLCDDSLTQIETFIDDRMGIQPLINYGCLHEKDYGRSALLLFNRSSESLFSELYDLEERAKKFRSEVNVEVIDLENKIIEKRMNGTLTNSDRQEFAQQMATLSQTIAVETRSMENMTGTVRATGFLLEGFIPFLMENSRLTLINTYGFDSLDEIYDIRDFMIQYGKDVRDAPLEIEMAVRHTYQMSNKIHQLYQLLAP